MAVNTGPKYKQRLFDMTIVFLGKANAITVRSQQQTFSNIKSPFLSLLRIDPYHRQRSSAALL